METPLPPPAHSEAPWTVATPGNGGVQKLILSADGTLLAIVGNFSDGEPREIEANARLMAAAPGLKEALMVAENTIRERLMHAGPGTDEQHQLNWVLSAIHSALANAA